MPHTRQYPASVVPGVPLLLAAACGPLPPDCADTGSAMVASCAAPLFVAIEGDEVSFSAPARTVMPDTLRVARMEACDDPATPDGHILTTTDAWSVTSIDRSAFAAGFAYGEAPIGADEPLAAIPLEPGVYYLAEAANLIVDPASISPTGWTLWFRTGPDPQVIRFAGIECPP